MNHSNRRIKHKSNGLKTQLKTFHHNLLFLAVTGFSLGSQVVHAQQQPSAAAGQDELEEIFVTGSRRAVGSAADVASPVDIIESESLRAMGATDVADMLRTAVPSLNVGAHPLSGTSSSVRPPTLRGLSPDHVLILINGKRHHRAADIPTFSGGISDGSQGPDLSSIPSIALKQIQVLRDGAAAQYGSDAIAGVINFVANDSPEGGSAEIKLGETYEGDGDAYQVAATYGMQLGESGFVRFSGEFNEADLTERAVQRGDAADLITAGNTAVPSPATRFGTPEIRNDIKLFANMAVDAGPDREFYGFGGYSERDTDSDFFYRNPTDRDGVFTSNGNYLIGDMTPDDGVNCDGGVDFGGSGVVNNPIGVGSADAAARLAAVMADPLCYSGLEKFPGGYTPWFGSTLSDMFGTLGVRGELDNGVLYDISGSGGRNKLAFRADNVANPSLGSLSPTHFSDLGDRIQTETNINIDLSREFAVSGMASPLNVAAGYEWRKEEFEVTTGEPESWEAGVLATQGFLVGEEAYPGYTPQISGVFDRDNYAVYLDIEGDVTESLLLGAAVRYEDFSDFGDETTFKVSSLFKLTDSLGVRATYSTGFHAPTPGQQNFSALTTELNTDGSLIDTGVIPPTSPVAALRGGKQLEPETSESYTLGLVYDAEWMSLTVDYYFIQMEDRLTQSASYSLTDAERDALVVAGYPGASGIGTFRFFTNDFSSDTEGVDIVASWPLNFVEEGSTMLDLSANWTQTEVTSYDAADPNEQLSETRVIQLEENNPEWRAFMTLSHTRDRWRAQTRVNYFDDFTELHVNAGSLRIDAGSQITVDVEAGYNLTENLELVVGADNVFDSNPDHNPWDFIVGSKYPTTSPAGINGGFYYTKLRYDF